MAGNLFAGLGDFGRNLFESTVFSIPFDIQRQREAQAAIQKRRQEAAAYIAQIGQQGPQSSEPFLGGASMFDQSGGVLPEDQQPAMTSPPQDQQDPMMAARRALAQGAIMRNGDYGKAWDIIKPADPYTLTSADTRYDGNNQEVARGRPQPYTLSGPEGAGQIRYSGDNQPLAAFTTPGVSLPGGPSTPAGPAIPAGPAAPAGSLDPIAFFNGFVGPHEGGLNPHDANGSPTNFGINQAANPGVDVRKLTKDQAARIFADKYFAQSGADKLPPALAAVHADTAFINPQRAQQFLQQSGGNPQRYMDLRDGWMQSLVQSDPAKYGPYAKAWANRNRDLRAYAEQAAAGTAPAPQTSNAPAGGGPPGFVTAPPKPAPARDHWTQISPSQQRNDVTGEIRAVGGAPSAPGRLGQVALKQQAEHLDSIRAASTINLQFDKYLKQIENGQLRLGPLENLGATIEGAVGMTDRNARNIASFKATLERVRNDSLRLNKGVQTEGDAQRAWNELLTNLNDPKLVHQRLQEIQQLNEMALAFHEDAVTQMRADAGLPPMDVSKFRVHPVAAPPGAAVPPPGKYPPKPAAAAAPRIRVYNPQTGRLE